MAEPIYRVVDNGLGELIAVGANGYISHSVDNGVSWITRNSGTTEHLYGAAYGDVLGTTGWIVVGANGTVLRSYNGSTWFTLSAFTAEDLYDVAFGGVFIAVGTNGIMATSENFGDIWQLNESGTSVDLHSIEIDSASYIIVGADDTVIVGTVLSLNFNIEIIEGLSVTEASTATGVFEKVLSEGFQALDSAGGRVAGQKVQFTTTGTVEAGDLYRITLDGVNYDVTVVGETTQSEIVDSFVSLIEPTTKFTAYNNGGVLVVTSNNPPTPFTYTSSVVDAGTIDIAIAELLLQNSIVQEVSAQVTNAEIGDSFTITLNGVDFTYVAVAADDSATASSLAALIDADPDYVAFATGDTITIYAAFPDASFTYAKSTINGGATDDQDITLSLLAENTIDGMAYYEFLTETVLADEVYSEPNGVYNEVVVEVADTLTAVPNTGSFQHTLVETADITDTPVYEWFNGIGGSILLPALEVSGDLLVGQLLNGSIVLPLVQTIGDYAQALGGTIVLPLLSASGSVGIDAQINGTIQLPFLDILGQFIISEGENEYVVWVINTKNKAHSTYTNFKANSLVSFNGEDLIADDTGIHALTGEEDNGVAIEAKITWVPTDYGSGNLKRLDAAYVNIRHSVDGKLTTLADENELRHYDCAMLGHQTGMHKKRVLLVRGLAAEHWEIGYEGSNGKIAIKDIEITPVASKRRIK